MSWPLSIPPAVDVPYSATKDTFKFTAVVACKICFGPPLNGVTHTFAQGETWGPPVPGTQPPYDIPYNVVTPPTADCNPFGGPIDTGHVIHVGS